jgi:predicted O-methyltransferase YrrM
MNPYIAAAVAEMDKVSVSRFEHPGSWAMDPTSCRFLAAFTRALGAKRVLEFGSGFSTLMMAREIPAQEGNYLLSVDDSEKYTKLAREAFETSECPAKVEFRTAPLKLKMYGPRVLLGYTLPKGLLEAMGPFDLVLIDAPHHDYGRESVFYDAFAAVAPGGYLVLDDANRADMEKEYVRAWLDTYGDAIDPIMLEGIGNGLCVIEKLDDCAPRYSRRGLLKTTLKTIRNYSRYLSRQEE